MQTAHLPSYSRTQALASTKAEFIYCRWGGGAEPGKTHVYLHPFVRYAFISAQCVVDDFGDLVAVPA